MIVSWNWLKDYLPLAMPHEEFARRLMLAGLNHESTTPVGGDLAIDLEVTSNRPDCLGHLGIAREASVIFNLPLKAPLAAPRESSAPITEGAKVRLECPELCYRYTARVLRGVKVGPSPAWLVQRLATVGLTSINNVVDVTNYVLMEGGQPLHAFDLAKLKGREIIVREPQRGEKLTAINHRVYDLEPGMCVIADRDGAVGLGGVMGGADTEVGLATKDVLIEAAEFAPLSIRNTARRLSLHSPSSYRFERGLDPEGVDWASRRACELVLQVAGGELAAGVIDVGRRPQQPAPVVLRFSQMKRILGIEVEPAEARRILTALGAEEQHASAERVAVVPPSWRRDLTREIDLVEEVARIHGYDAIPEDVSVPMKTSAPTRLDRVLAKVRHVLTAAGFAEALTFSVVEEDWSDAFSPWTAAPALTANMPLVRRANRLRRSLVPSLLGARRTNQGLGGGRVELFETARVYLPQDGKLPQEELMLGIASGRDYLEVKGVIEALVRRLNPQASLSVAPVSLPLLDPSHSGELRLDGELLGYFGEVSAAALKQFELKSAATVAEIKLSVLAAAANLIPQYRELSAYPAVSRDVNLEVADAIRWADVAATARTACGPHLEALEYRDTYRDEKLAAQGKKSVLLSFSVRLADGTLTGEAADEIRDAVVAACQGEHGAKLRM